MLATGPIRVLIADDSATALRAISTYLRTEQGFEVVGTAGNGAHLVREAQRLLPDLVLADLSMPEMNGLQATVELRKTFPQLRIIIFTELSGLALKDECLRRGADGFLYKSELSENLMGEVHRLFPGGF
jgi:DNA-binding NarL/FixJ family response regulator